MDNGTHSVYVTMGASNHAKEDRQLQDFYATEPAAMELLLKEEQFAPEIWECACGMGHLSEILKAHGYKVISTDLVYRGYGDPEPLDFLIDTLDKFEGDIITNPPYKFALEFVERALESVLPGRKVAMFLRLQFLEGQKRKQLFLKNPHKTVYVSSSRLYCAKNGEFERYKDTKAIAYAWFEIGRAHV